MKDKKRYLIMYNTYYCFVCNYIKCATTRNNYQKNSFFLFVKVQSAVFEVFTGLLQNFANVESEVYAPALLISFEGVFPFKHLMQIQISKNDMKI